MKMSWNMWTKTAGAAMLLASVATVANAQQLPTVGGPSSQRKVKEIVIAGENPALNLLDKENGNPVTAIWFWRAQWSPVGAGAICYVTVKAGGDSDMRVAITDNEKLVDYTTKMGGVPGQGGAYTILKGTITQTNSGNDRTETCKSDKYTVVATWKDLQTPTWNPEFKIGNDVVQNFVMVKAGGAEVTINGKKAPGIFDPKATSPFKGAFLTVNETWKRLEPAE